MQLHDCVCSRVFISSDILSMSVYLFVCRHFEPSGTDDWQQIGSKHTLPNSGGLGNSISVAKDGRSVLVGGMMSDSGVGEAAMYARASATAAFQLAARISSLDPMAGGSFAVAVALNGDGTQLAIGRQ